MNDIPSPERSAVAATLASGSSPRRRSRLKLVLAAVVVLGVCAAALLWWRHEPASDAPRYQSQNVRRGDLQVIVTASGNLAPVNEVEVGSELSGIVKSVEVDFNDHVRVGQVLARLDTSKLEAQVLQSKASLAAARAKVLQARATVEEASRNLERLQAVLEMSQGRAVSQQDLDAGKAALDRARADQASAEATVRQTEAVLKAFETDLSKAVIHSPINGVVLSRSVDPGQTVAASLQAPVLFDLAEDLTKMELHVDVDEADVGQVREGQDALFTVDAYPDRSFPARISQVRFGSKTVDGVVTYETLLEVDNSDLSLRPGMTATANITVKEVHDALLVPNAALRFVPPVRSNAVNSDRSRSGGSILSRLFPRPPRRAPEQRQGSKGDKKDQRVWVVRDGALAPIPVTTGATDGAFTEITDANLEEGQEVVVDLVSASS